MQPLQKRWFLRPLQDDGGVARLARELNALPEALSRALYLRGVTDLYSAQRFFRGGLENVHDAFLLQDMDAAAERLARAITQDETVLVYGDYDVDGTTATAVMTHFLRANGCEVSYFIPERLVQGYGLSKVGVREAKRRKASLMIALDCGITAVEEAALARKNGIDLIIADHHEPGPELPDATAVLNPKRHDCAYPFTGLSGCGVGFKLIQATLHKLNRPPEEAHQYLDLLAVSIAADIVPVLDENRVLMREGLGRMKAEPREGIKALAEVADVDLDSVACANIVFGLAPRINAAGRLGRADVAVELFLEEDPKRALQLAHELEEVNRRRRTIDSQTVAQALAQAATFMPDDPAALVLFHETWHPGILGIVASRVAEHYHRPTVMLSGSDGLARGSARGVGGVSILKALTACGDLLNTVGGHAAAAGLSLATDNLDRFRAALHEAVRTEYTPEDLLPQINIDAELDLKDVTDGLNGRFWAVLNQFGPHGPDNPRPVFWGREIQQARPPKRIGRDQSHLRLTVRQGEGGPNIAVIGFGLSDRFEELRQAHENGRRIELAFCLSENNWNGNRSLQLEARDARASTVEERPADEKAPVFAAGS